MEQHGASSTGPPQAVILTKRQMVLVYVTGPFAFSFGGMLRFLVPLRAQELGAPLEIIGVLVGAGALIPAVSSIPVGAIVDRFGARRAYIIGAAASGLIAFLYVLSTSYWALLGLQLVLGLFRPMTWVAAQTYVSMVGAADQRATITGRFSFATNLGTLVSPLVVGASAQMVGFQNSFLLPVLMAAAFSVVCWTLPEVRASETKQRKDSMGFSAAVTLLRERGIQIAMLLTFSRLWIGAGWGSFYPVLLVGGVGLPPVLAGAVMSSHSGVATVVALSTGRFAKWFSKEMIAAVSLALGGLGVILSPFTTSVVAAFLPSVLIGVGTGLSLPLLIAIMSERAPREQRGLAMGLRESVNQASSTVSPLALGALAGVAGMTFGFVASGGFALFLLGTAVIMHLGERRQRPES